MSTYRFSCRADEDAWELRALVCGAASSTPATACFVAYVSLALAGLPVVLSVMMHTKGCVDAYVAFCFYTGPVELSYSADAFMCGADGSQRVRGPNALVVCQLVDTAGTHVAACCSICLQECFCLLLQGHAAFCCQSPSIPAGPYTHMPPLTRPMCPCCLACNARRGWF
jgi:hypothetical protein